MTADETPAPPLDAAAVRALVERARQGLLERARELVGKVSGGREV